MRATLRARVRNLPPEGTKERSTASRSTARTCSQLANPNPNPNPNPNRYPNPNPNPNQVEREAAGSAKLTVLEESLAQKEAVLAQKDADLRASIQSISQMQKDHREEVTHDGRDPNPTP